MPIDVEARVAERVQPMLELRRDLHMHPELAFQEKRTAGLVAQRLSAAGLEVHDGVAETGVVALLRTSRPGRTLMVRADMDALPLTEESRAPYRSQNPGAMHACGHDGHMAALLTVAEILASSRADLAGTVKFVFQPAEETIRGAKRMVEEGVLTNPQPDGILAMHLWNNLPVGKVGVRTGAAFASADELSLVVRGKGGHGAMPHQAVDAIVAASHIIAALQTLVSRETPPLETAVITIGMIHGGTAFNIIPEEVRMGGTLRAFDPAIRDRLLQRVPALATNLAAALGASCEFEVRNGCPPVTNDDAISAVVRNAAAQIVGTSNVVVPDPITGSDDMAYFMEGIPGCYFVVGSANPSKGLDKPHHNPGFDFDEEALPIAARIMLSSILAYLGQ